MEAAASSSCLEILSLSSDQRRAMEELIKGQEQAHRLRNLLHKSTKNDGSQLIIYQDLVANILSSFTNSLSILKNGDSYEVEAHTQLSSPCCKAYQKPEDSGESSKNSTVKDRKRRNKRRKFAESWTEHTSTLKDDGQAWRKYGEKIILNAKFARYYYRCAHKIDQGCQARKQLQRIEEEPPVYRATYYGNHTCKNFLKASQLYTTSVDQCPIINFGGTQITDKDFNPFFSPFPSGKQESKDNHEPRDMTQTHNQSTSFDDFLVSPKFTAFESTDGYMTMLSSDHGNVISGVNSSPCSLNMSFDVDDFLEFEF